MIPSHGGGLAGEQSRHPFVRVCAGRIAAPARDRRLFVIEDRNVLDAVGWLEQQGSTYRARIGSSRGLPFRSTE